MSTAPGVDPLKYQTAVTGDSDEYMTVKVRYKDPNGDVSKLVEKAVDTASFTAEPSRDFIFAAAVTEFGLIITGSEYKGKATVPHVIKLAESGIGRDEYGLREEFVSLVRRYDDLFR